ncbi:thrombospondin-type laminin G domain and EAR repeat-containing protein isoform X2 [Oryzias melastigma]|uniref:thrombospondin-type laminin G domain and EAR repeat-containing protein isoform X2 n=1 Tax=Oryzias melastigma TaxID=30732 RepID=UPI000CF7D62F|nr:thrombospondin-type laminin G domain and EAR repeat-containing protein isoform X2 [Oryzias melastigma]
MLMRPNKSSLPSAGMWCYPLLLTGVLLTVPVQSQSWRPCTDLLPLDLLSRALASPSQSLTSQLQMVQSRGSRGFRLAGTMATSMSFRASQIFTNCNYFPAEFSLVATLKISKLRQKTNEYIFSVVKEGSNLLLLGLRVSENHLHLVILSPAVGRRSRVTFKDVNLDDNRWHTVVLAVTGPYATLTVDCGLPLEIKQVQSFPSALSTKGSRFFIGGRGQWRGRFTGLLRQLVLLPGSDATPRLCPNSEPSLAELSVPQVLKSTPLQPDSQGPVYPYEAETRVTVGDHPPCSKQEHGQLWFNTQRKSLFICDGLMWRTLLQNKERLDYVEDYQDLYTRSETLDIEVFFIPSEGLFMAAANKDSRLGSGIFRWKNGSFHFYQNISTQEARAWKHFTIDNKTFLVVADLREEEPELSIIYRWNKRRRRFVRHQALETHGAQDWEAFQIHNSSFLVVANHRARDVNHNIHSVIYRWNPDTKTVGATDWEAFQIDGRFFLAVANSQKFTDTGQSLYSLNSTVYELNTLTQTFIRFQDILTHSALDWEFFIIGDEKFLVVANSHDGSSYSLNSVIYRWQGYEGFVPVHSLPTFGCRDWEYFSTDEGSFLIYSSAMSPLSKVFRLRTY